jgi:hypothetical protein
MIAIDITPALHKPARASEHAHDGGRRFAFDCQLDGAQTITLLGVRRAVNAIRQRIGIVHMMKGDLHGGSLPKP